MGIYYIKCAVCKKETHRIANTYWDFLRYVTGDDGWELTQTDDGKLIPICDCCGSYFNNPEEYQGEN